MCSIDESDGAARGDFACAQAGCGACQDALIREHSGLIHTVLRRVARGGVPYAELVQEGRLALWRAVLGFDASRGVRFATYGGLVIERALWDAVRRAHRADDAPIASMASPEVWALRSQQQDVRAALAQAVGQLPKRLQGVLTRLYGLDGQAACTQAALGRAWGISRERIRQLHLQAVVRLRHPGLSTPLYHLCEQDSRAAYLQALQDTRAWQRRQRR